MPLSAGDISFDPAITQQEFRTFSRLVGQGIFPTPLNPPGGTSLFAFDLGLAATGVPVDTGASYWQKAIGSTGNDFSVGNYVAVPRLVVSKGIGAAAISGSYAKVQKTGAAILGGTLDVPIINGGLVTPTLDLRASYARLQGIDVYKLSTYGVELLLGKGFGPVTPYGAVGRQRIDATGTIKGFSPPAQPPFVTDVTLKDKSDINRYTLGVRISMLLPKITIEATQAEKRSYSAKVSFGF